MNDPYQVLGVSPNATDAEVKAAYRRLAKEYHPDRNGGSAEAEKKMMQINDAYTQIVEMRKNGRSYSYGGYSQGWGGSSQAQQQMKRVPIAWANDAHQELKELARDEVRDQGLGLRR